MIAVFCTLCIKFSCLFDYIGMFISSVGRHCSTVRRYDDFTAQCYASTVCTPHITSLSLTVQLTRDLCQNGPTYHAVSLHLVAHHFSI